MRVLTLLLIALAVALPVRAQDAAPPAHISFVDGSAVVYHSGDESEPAVVNMPVVQGDRLKTLGRARVDVMFPDGSSIAIDPDSDVEFVTATRVRVLAGAIEHLAARPIDPRSPSAQNLPPDLQPYQPEFDQNGSWQYEPQYGNVWYPSYVSADWRPYYDGYWSSYPSYGWTWVGYERWAWPTHHYGRWGYARSRWFWIPGRSFAAAWVSWGTAPDYVSWCPLGYDGRPVIALSIGLRSSWNAWTVIPRDRFGARGYSARRYAVEPQRIAASAAFIEHRTPPSRERRGTFSAPGNASSTRRGDDAFSGSRNTGVAVPRYEQRPANNDWRRTSDGQRASSDERRATSDEQRASSGERRAPSAGQRAPTREQQAPSNERRVTTREPGGNPGDHPAYQPRYEPRYQPRYDSTYGQPRDDRSRGEPAYRDRRSNADDPRVTTPENRPTTQPRRETREVAPPAERRPPLPPRSEGAGPRSDERTRSAPAREPRGGSRDGGESRDSGGSRDRGASHERQSSGTATRRPR